MQNFLVYLATIFAHRFMKILSFLLEIYEAAIVFHHFCTDEIFICFLLFFSILPLKILNKKIYINF